ncbi:cupin domain-containing protein [Euzebya tangerina]|uniref:cupin domain-containing protein n=1 Tax=Euzebya tangerina TaxID=591198 RepID=UPI000E30E03A|nr:cupin domain-containing protein [Euzebya tangerina]
MAEPVRVIRDDALVEADPTSGMVRRRAVETPGLWAGQVITEPGVTSGWHHHDTNVSFLYIVRGVLRFECEGIAGHVDAMAGDYVEVPAMTVHRESNPGTEPSLVIIGRSGTGIPTVNVEEAPPPH